MITNKALATEYHLRLILLVNSMRNEPSYCARVEAACTVAASLMVMTLLSRRQIRHKLLYNSRTRNSKKYYCAQ